MHDTATTPAQFVCLIEIMINRYTSAERFKLQDISSIVMSVVWEIFTKSCDDKGNDFAVCGICEKSLRLPVSKTTTNLLYHLQKEHKPELEKRRKPKIQARTPEHKQVQATLHRSFSHTMSTEARTLANRRLAIFLADTSSAFRLPHTRSFIKFVQALKPAYKPPSRRTIIKIMESEVNSIDNANKKLLADPNASFSFTMDCWSSFNVGTGLLAISGHILSPTMDDRVSVILDCAPLDLQSHSAEVICEKICECMRRLDIGESRASAVVADGASAMKKSAADLGVKYVQCCAHVINLAVSGALKCEYVATILKSAEASSQS